MRTAAIVRSAELVLYIQVVRKIPLCPLW
jgi:hypothetical protein